MIGCWVDSLMVVVEVVDVLYVQGVCNVIIIFGVSGVLLSEYGVKFCVFCFFFYF